MLKNGGWWRSRDIFDDQVGSIVAGARTIPQTTPDRLVKSQGCQLFREAACLSCDFSSCSLIGISPLMIQKGLQASRGQASAGRH
jgi:hypothetical protein